MHRVEIRLTHEGTDAPQADFEIYNEVLKDGKYVELAPMRTVASGGAPIVLFLEADECVVVVAKGNVGRMVYDKEQNANVRVETEAEIKDHEAREENLKRAQADQNVRAAQARVGEADDAAEKARYEAEAEVRKAEASRAEVQATKTSQGASTTTSNPTQAKPAAAPASTNTGPADSKQIKGDGGPGPVKSNG